MVAAEGDVPSPRKGHSACALVSPVHLDNNAHLVMFGGDDGANDFNDLHILYVSLTEQKLEPDYAWKKLQYQIQQTSVSPSEIHGRTEHCTVVHNNQLWIFGGYSIQSGAYLNDLWSIDLGIFFGKVVIFFRKYSTRTGYGEVSPEIIRKRTYRKKGSRLRSK